MEISDYKKYTISTIENYPLKSRTYLRSLFISGGIAQEESQMTHDQLTAIDISGYDLNQQLKICIEGKDESLGIFEKWEFTKDYKYSVLFRTREFAELLTCVTENSTAFEGQYMRLYDRITSPCFLDVNERTALLKFNRKFEAVHPRTGEEQLMRYPIVVAFHKQEQIVEIRFDALKRFLMENPDSFYAELVENVCDFICEMFHHELQPLDLDNLKSYVQGEDVGVRLIAQSMKMSNGSYAQLEVGKNEEYVLPFIGELKNILLEYSSEFEKTPHLKDAFEQFIYEKETMSDYPWIELLWKNEIKTRAIHVKLTFNYYQKGYCLLQHYFNTTLIGMERMDHVVRFINEAMGTPQHTV